MTPKSTESPGTPAGPDPQRAPGGAAPAPDPARRRAAAYLDLWERHVVQLAVEGAAEEDAEDAAEDAVTPGSTDSQGR